MRPSNSIRSRIALFVGMVALIALVGGVLVVRGQLGLARELGEQKTLELARLTSSAISQFAGDTRSVLEGLASQPDIQAMEPERCQSLVETGHRILRHYVNLFVVRADGTLLCSALPRPERRDPTPSDSWWPTATHPDSTFTVGAPQLGQLSGVPVTVFSVPVTGPDGERLGYLGAALDVYRVYDMLTNNERPDGSLLTVARFDGLVIARSEAMEEWVGRMLPDRGLGVQHALQESGLQVTESAEGHPTVWGFHVVRGLPWTVYAGIPLTDIRGAALRAAGPQLATLFVLLVLPGLLGLGLMREVGSAVRQLLSGARRASREGEALPEVGLEELRALSQEFNATLQERDRATAEQRRARERVQAIVENAAFGIYVVDGSGRILQANPALAAILGYDTPSSLEGIQVDAILLDRDARERLEALDATGERSAEIRLRRDDGTPVPVRLSWSRLHLGNGEAASQFMVEDLTERYELEQQIRESQKLEAVGRLAGGVAHDFNNRLTVITGQSELLLEALPEESPHREQVEAILHSASRSAELTAQLLAFSRRQVVQPRLLDLRETVVGMRDMLGRLLGREVELTIEPGEPVPVRADPGQLEQVIMNLCTNARDAMEGRGCITLSTSLQVLTPGDAGSRVDAEAGRYAVLTVADTGHGMDEETRERIFEPFFTTKAQGKGTGLGLSTVYGITVQAGGHLRVRSWPGRGTQIEVWLPAAEASVEAAAEQDPSEANSPDGRGEVLLLAEDEAPVREVLLEVLGRAGYTVLPAEDGLHALAVAAEHPGEIDLLVTDMVMPGMDGQELATRLTAGRPETAVLFLSGYADEPPRAPDTGSPSAFLGKPFAQADLRREVRRLLDRRRRGREATPPARAGGTAR